MKGLLIKDLKVLRSQGRVFLMLAIFYLAFSLLAKDFSMLGTMLVVLCSMLPVTVMAYDEQSKWDRYALSMPVSRAMVVSSKYLLGVLLSGCAFLLSVLANVLVQRGAFFEAVQNNLLGLGLSLLFLALVLPMSFKFGVAKGRLVMMLAVFAIAILGGLLFSNNSIAKALDAIAQYFLLIAAGLFIASIGVSIGIYRRREF